jgi:hypothetical protein
MSTVRCDWGGKEECINLECVHNGPHKHGYVIIKTANGKIPSKCRDNSYCIVIRDACSCAPDGDEIDID